MFEEIFQSILDGQRVVPIATKLILAFLIALPIAYNRERFTRIMGLRTFPLVAVASCAYILIATSMADSDASTNARVLQGLITGMGFIGGGAILKNGDEVKGTATAAGIWATGAIGAAVAFGFLEIALLVTAMTFIVLRVLTTFKDKIEQDETLEP